MPCLAFIQKVFQRSQGGQGGQPTQPFPQAPVMPGFQGWQPTQPFPQAPVMPGFPQAPGLPGMLPTFQPPYQPVTHIYQGWQPTQPVQGGLPPQQFVQPQRAGLPEHDYQVDMLMALLQSLHDKFSTFEARTSQNMGTGPDVLRHLDQVSKGEVWVMTSRRE